MNKESRYRIVLALNSIERTIEQLPNAIAEGIVEALKVGDLDVRSCVVPGCTSTENLVAYGNSLLCSSHYNTFEVL